MSYLDDVSIVTDSFGTELEIYYGGNPGYLIVSIVGPSEVASIDMDADALEKAARRFLNEAARIRGDKNPLIIRRFDEVI